MGCNNSLQTLSLGHPLEEASQVYSCWRFMSSLHNNSVNGGFVPSPRGFQGYVPDD